MNNKHWRLRCAADQPGEIRTGNTEVQGTSVEFTDLPDNSRIWHFGGPGGDIKYDRYGEPTS